tara:strand:+ start:1858 stop:2559 length:702 start_codon:yes stop_codon:yes gene_type:complete
MLEWNNHLLYCRNVSCGSQSQKRVQHFAKTLKIKGLGPAAVEKLGLSSPNDVYQLSFEDIVEGLNSEKLAEKLLVEIQNSKKASLNEVLPALSIPLIGKTATEKLSVVCEDIYDINTESCKRAGLGPKATESLMDFLSQEDIDYAYLPHSMKFRKTASAEIKGIVCISGRLKSFKTKADAARALSELGYKVVSSLTKEVTILVNESGIESAKTMKARESGIMIIENLLDFIGD